MAWSLGDLANLVTVVTALGGGTAAFRWLRARRLPAAEGYSITDIRQAMRWYVEPDVITRDPSHHDEPADVDPASREPLFRTLDRLLSPDSPTRYVLLLGDSGMGKTAALVNYYVRFLRSLRRPYRIAMAPLTQEHIVDWIRAREDKSGTLLLLDALDEYVRPGDGVRAALQELARETASFAKVAITCRSQYFANDEELPAFAEVVRRAPRPAGTPPQESIERLYIAPLSDGQINRYLAKRFPFPHRKARRHARAVIARVPRLSVRPMLLSFLDDVSLLKQAPSMNEIYEQGVHGWLRRECSTQTEVRELRQFSKKLAAFMWAHQKPSVHREEALAIAQEMGVTMEERRLSGRSLLNRDGAGRWKFAHRSIMEFLVIDALWEGAWSGGPVATDQMRSFFMTRLIRNRDSLPPFTHALEAGGRAIVADICRGSLPDGPMEKEALEAIARVLMPDVRIPRAVLLISDRDARDAKRFRLRVMLAIGDPLMTSDVVTMFDPEPIDGVILEPEGGPRLWRPLGIHGKGSLLSIPLRQGNRFTHIFLFLVPTGEKPEPAVIEALAAALR